MQLLPTRHRRVGNGAAVGNSRGAPGRTLPTMQGKDSEMNDGTIELELDPTRKRLYGTTYHGNINFDVPYITMMDDGEDDGLFPLWQGGCMTKLVLPSDIKHLVSLYVWERYSIHHNDMLSELYVTMMDSEEQGMDQVNALGEWVNLCRRTGPVLVHCQAGLNRSSLVVAKTLSLNEFGTGDEIVNHIRSTRSPACLCNPTFEAEVRSW